MADWLFSLEEAERLLPEETEPMRFVNALRHGTMRVGLYAPRGDDIQTPHSQDELYVIISGSGTFANDGDERPFAANDVIFVKAGAEHRFSDVTQDFATWVIFWGPEGGES